MKPTARIVPAAVLAGALLAAGAAAAPPEAPAGEVTAPSEVGPGGAAAEAPEAAAGEAVEAPPTPAGFALGDAARGRERFLKTCASCHGEDGSGHGRIRTDPPARDLRDAALMDRRSDWEIFLVIRDGGKARGLSPKMLPWGKILSDDQIRDLAAFVRSLSHPRGAAPPAN
jgi:mono/diheme cytochrome c family protein